MIMKSFICSTSSNIIYSLFLILFLAIAGCSSDDGAGSTSNNVSTRTTSLGDSVKNVLLENGKESRIIFTFTVPAGNGTGTDGVVPINARGDATINITETLKHVTLSSSPVTKNTNRFESLRLLAYALIKDAFAASQTQVTAHLSYAGDTEVCSSPYVIGPFTMAGAVGEAVTSDTATVELTPVNVDIISSGSLEICVITTPPIDAYLNVSNVAVDFQPCQQSTVDITGSWSGTFQCTPFFGLPETPAPITLHISQNNDGSYHYEDSEAKYDGHLCGNKYKFKGGAEGFYTESGTLTFSSSTSATKSSMYIYDYEGASGGGTCSDTLEKL